MSKKFCYWTCGDKLYVKMIQSLVFSARLNKVEEDFIVFTDTDNFVGNAININIGKIENKSHYLFKLDILRNHLRNLDYEYFIFLDSDCFFVKKPENILKCLNGDPVHSFLESNCLDPLNVRGDWWGCPLKEYGKLMREMGVIHNEIYNVNAGFFIVNKNAIDTFYDLAMSFWNYAQSKNYNKFTEEPPLAYATHMLVANARSHTLFNIRDIWASDWTGVYNNMIPNNNSWEFTDYMLNTKFTVTPSIVHAMRSKNALIKFGTDIEKIINISAKEKNNVLSF